MSWFEIIWVFAFGLIIGSFLACASYRIPRGISLAEASSCPYCQHRLNYLDLIPVMSFLFWHGRCRYCKAPIAFRYPVIELLTAIVITLVYMRWNQTFPSASTDVSILAAILFSCAMLVVSFTDLEFGIIPNKVTYPGIVVGLLLSFFTVGVTSAIEGALLFGGMLFIAGLVFPRGLGGGDIKLAAMIGIFCGLDRTVMAMGIASVLGLIYVTVLLIARKVTLKSAVVYGPFLAIGGWLAFMMT